LKLHGKAVMPAEVHESLLEEMTTV
jgi:hypothetical protein